MINFFKYLISKRSEINDLDFRDALLAQVNLRIYRTKTHKTIEKIPLKYLKFIHSLDREHSRDVLKHRIAILGNHKDKILVNGEIQLVNLNQYLPSVSPMKVVEGNSWNYLAFEGNGRIAALKEVFNDDEHILVEVEQYYFRNKKVIVKMLNRLRKLNGLL